MKVVSSLAFAYDITTVTGRESGNGTTAQIVLILYGDQGHSEPLFIEDCGQVTMKEGELQHFEVCHLLLFLF